MTRLKKNNIDKPVLISVEFLNNEKVPLQYQGLKIGNVISHRIVINSNFNWGNIDFINQKLQNAHDNGKLASKNVEGLAVHEMGHFLTYLDCDDVIKQCLNGNPPGIPLKKDTDK